MCDCALSALIFSQIIHKCGVWLCRDDAKKAMDACNLFCSGYSFLAAKFFALKLPRYHVEPSLHAFKHTAVRLDRQLGCGARRILSPAVFLCEMSEDFVGAASRLSRRVSGRTVGARTLERFLIKVHLHWSAGAP